MEDQRFELGSLLGEGSFSNYFILILIILIFIIFPIFLYFPFFRQNISSL